MNATNSQSYCCKPHLFVVISFTESFTIGKSPSFIVLNYIMNSRESASDLLRKALYALEASGHGGDPRCDAEDGNIDGNHSFSDTAGASTSASTDYRGWPMPEASPVSRYTVTPVSLPIASSGGSRMGHLGQMPPPPFKKLHTRSIYSNRAVNYFNKAVTMFMRQCSLPMKLQIGFYFT